MSSLPPTPTKLAVVIDTTLNLTANYLLSHAAAGDVGCLQANNPDFLREKRDRRRSEGRHIACLCYVRKMNNRTGLEYNGLDST